MPWIVLAGLLLFGAGGIGAGLMGVPRRVVDIGYGGEAPAIWRPFMAMVGIGGVLFASALAVSVFGVLRSLVPGRRGLAVAAEPHVAAARSAAAPAAAAWTGPLAVVLLVAAMYGATIGAFELMQSLPVTTAGGGARLREAAMKLEIVLMLAVAAVWLALALVYALVPSLNMPGYIRVWGIGALVFLALAAVLYRAARRKQT
ncbi:MAG: hypothetical protein M5U33_05005 [Pseudorhodoplanes sp.]|nr:hypothetical protein [Pseudorhodoplanes sp.]